MQSVEMIQELVIVMVVAAPELQAFLVPEQVEEETYWNNHFCILLQTTVRGIRIS